MTFLINIPRPIAIFASHQLANIDYNIATRVSEDVSKIIEWSYNHDLPILAKVSINILENLDQLGSFLIYVVSFVIYHTN